MTRRHSGSRAAFTFASLSPTAFLDRAVSSFATRPAVIDGDVRLTYAELGQRCSRLVSALASAGIAPGDRVAALCSNSHTLLELHHAVPARGAVLVPMNTRLTVHEMHHILDHSGARLLVATVELAHQAASLAELAGVPLIVSGGEADTYEAWLPATARVEDRLQVVDERSLLAINYTSGTTARPKGVMYHHRGAYLQALAMAYHARLGPAARYLWTLPMFHCNGWCFTWAVTAAGGTHVCLRKLDATEVWRLLREEGITAFSAAPTVLTMIAEAPAAAPLPRRVHVDTGGAPPSPALLERLDALGLDVTHLYGLTETFGPIAVNEWQPEWDALPETAAARMRARQGIGNIAACPLRVLDADGADVPADGVSVGDVAVRGNDVMLGYYRDPEATAAATRNGCFVTGDLAVMHPDGYIEIRDRAKDIIISGGENIASVEVERAIDAHPDVVESAVVGMADTRWGEVPVAFVTRRAGAELTEADLRAFLRGTIAGFKIPHRVSFTDLPRTSTGKIQKNVLRERAARSSEA